MDWCEASEVSSTLRVDPSRRGIEAVPLKFILGLATENERSTVAARRPDAATPRPHCSTGRVVKPDRSKRFPAGRGKRPTSDPRTRDDPTVAGELSGLVPGEES